MQNEQFELAKQIYREIYSAICDLNEKHNVFCAPPAFIELDGVVYQAYQCLGWSEWDCFSIKFTHQMKRFMEGKVTFYSNKDGDHDIAG